MDQNLENRVKRLELLHIYGISAILLLTFGYFAYKAIKK